MLSSTLHVIIKELWKLQNFDKGKTAKYMRCMLQAILPGPPEQSLSIMEEMCHVIKKEAEDVRNHEATIDRRSSNVAFRLTWFLGRGGVSTS